MTTIYLIRHSERMSSSYIENMNTSDTPLVINEKDILSVKGEQRAALLANINELSNIDKVYTSKLVRTLSTAKYLLEKYNLKATIDERLDERRVGLHNDKDHPDWFVKQYKDPDFKTINGESQREVVARMNEVINEILTNNQDKQIAVFSHGYAICFYLLQFCNLTYIDQNKNITIKYQDKIILDGQLNAPEIFKLEFNNHTLTNITQIKYEELRK